MFPVEMGYQRFAACHVAGTDGADPFFPPGKAKDKNVLLAPQPSGEAWVMGTWRQWFSNLNFNEAISIHKCVTEPSRTILINNAVAK